MHNPSILVLLLLLPLLFLFLFSLLPSKYCTYVCIGRLCISRILRVCKRRLVKASLIWKTDDDDSDNTFAVMNTQHALSRVRTQHTQTQAQSFKTASSFPARVYVLARTVCVFVFSVQYGLWCYSVRAMFVYIYSGFGRMRQSNLIKIHLYYYYRLACVCVRFTLACTFLSLIYVISFGGPFNIKYFLSCHNATENR